MKISNRGAKRFPAGFTLIELLVVIAIIALLMAILMPALSRVRNQARSVACLTQIKQWGLYFSMYTDDNNGSFMEGVNGRANTHPQDRNHRWVKALGPYYKWDTQLTCCPNATKEWFTESGESLSRKGTFLGSTTAWGYYQRQGWLKPIKGSYGMNGFCNNPSPGYAQHNLPENHWRTPNIRGAAYIPLFLAGQRYNFWPEDNNAPPSFEGMAWDALPNLNGVEQHMGWPCLNRHNGFVNCVFLDWSARKIGLKELWTLKWHRQYNTTGPWTRAGRVKPSDWPQWMRSFKDY